MSDWAEYLSGLIGEQVQAVEDNLAADRLSIAMASIYRIYRGKLLDQTAVFVVPKRSGGPPLSDVLRHYRALRKNLEGEIVLILPIVKPHEVKRLVRERISFVVPGQQVFLSRNVVSLHGRPSLPREPADVGNPLSPSAQVLLLFHLQKHTLTGLTQVQIAKLLDWRPMTVSRAVQDIERARLGHTGTAGRANVLTMDHGRQLWEQAESWLRSPVRIQRFVRGVSPSETKAFTAAGITALSNYTMLAEDPVPVLAIHSLKFSALLRSGKLTVCPYREEGCSQVELWRYDPAPLAEDGTVDRLSLYLSLKGHPDERVEGSLHDLLEAVPWRT
jgi:hypothetical protein